VAFKDPTTGQITMVGENTGATSQSFTGNLVGGLNASVFNLYYTNSSLNEQQLANVAVTNKSFNFSVPADTIFTLTTPTAPSVTGVTPISGLTGGGQSVTILGSNFSGATSVSFGGLAAKSFTINSDSRITAVTPAHAAGPVDVTVAFPNGTSAISAADRFQYLAPNGTAPPTVASAASATLSGNQASAALSVLGASQYGAGTLTYTWATVGTPPARVSFSPNGNNSATSGTSVTVSEVATTLTVSPKSGAVTPNGTLQFSGTVKDQFGRTYTSPISWTVSGGGTIDSTGKFTAGSATGGPFTVTASVGSLSSTATVTISNNVNLAPNGTAYRWWNLASSTSDANRAAAPGLNDNNLTNNVVLSGGGINGQGDDNQNAYEAAGIIWGGLQSITRVTFTNGSFSPTYDGVFDANLGLQVTTDGSTWSSASAWTFSPAYAYNSAAAASKTYAFTGPALNILGVRVVGQVHTSDVGNNSWYDTATEVQVFGTPAPAAATYKFSDVIPLGQSAIGSFAGIGVPSASRTLPSGQQLRAITIASSTTGSDSDGANLTVSDRYAVKSSLAVKPSWTKAAKTITITPSSGSNGVIDDILYN
jgi:hypothetical protein